jgi:hypothetical protein
MAANVHANAQSANKAVLAKTGQPIAAKKRVSIHLESYADAKSAATAEEIATLLEERLSRRPSSSGQPEYKKPAKAAILKEPARPADAGQ